MTTEPGYCPREKLQIGSSNWIFAPNRLAVKCLEELTGKGIYEYLRNADDDRETRWDEMAFAFSASFRREVSTWRDCTFEDFQNMLPVSSEFLTAYKAMLTRLVRESFFFQALLPLVKALALSMITETLRKESTGPLSATLPTESSDSPEMSTGTSSAATT